MIEPTELRPFGARVEQRIPNQADRISSWADAAACATSELPTDAWFDIALKPSHIPQTVGEDGEDAIRICWSCPVRRPCLEWAIALHENGIWGATTDHERHQIRRARARNTRQEQP